MFFFPQLRALWPGCLHWLQTLAFFAGGAEVEDAAVVERRADIDTSVEADDDMLVEVEDVM